MAHGPQLADMIIQAIAAYTRGPAPFPDAETVRGKMILPPHGKEFFHAAVSRFLHPSVRTFLHAR